METQVTYKKEIFSPEETKLIDKAIKEGHVDELVNLLISVTPEKVGEIEKLQKALRPQRFVFESEKQKEAEIYISQHLNELTPEKEAELQKAIDQEKKERLEALSGGVVEIEASAISGTNNTEVVLSNDLSKVEGLGAESIRKLNTAGINNVDELKALPQENRIKILGPLVAHKIKNLTT